jgi:putative ABC transport system permease protein
VFESNDVTVSWQGSTADFFAISKLDIAQGYPFSYSDVLAYNRVIVLGSELAKTLFGARDPVGKNIRLKDMSFRVIGVLAPKGVGAFGIDQDNTAILPLTVGQKQLLGIDYYNSMSIQAADAYDIDFTKARIVSILRQNHRITDPLKEHFPSSK